MYVKTFAVTATALLAAAPCASADVITTYTDRTAFNSATGDPTPTIEDFGSTTITGIDPPSFNSTTSGFGFIEPGVTYSTTSGLSSIDFNIDSADSNHFVDGLWASGDGNRVLTITLDSPQKAIGFDTNKLMGTNFDITITFSSGSTFTQNQTVAQNSTPLEFFGWVSNLADIESIIIDGNGNKQDGLGTTSSVFMVDNFTFTTLPEPSSFLFVGMALCFALFLSRRR